jgi:hypothetical protein
MATGAEAGSVNEVGEAEMDSAKQKTVRRGGVLRFA